MKLNFNKYQVIIKSHLNYFNSNFNYLAIQRSHYRAKDSSVRFQTWLVSEFIINSVDISSLATELFSFLN